MFWRVLFKLDIGRFFLAENINLVSWLMLIVKMLSWSCQGLIDVPQRRRRYMYVTAILSGSPSIIQIRKWFVINYSKSCSLMDLEDLYYFTIDMKFAM